jgi:hypothetical protein
MVPRRDAYNIVGAVVAVGLWASIEGAVVAVGL